MVITQPTVGGIYIATTVIAVYTAAVLWRNRDKKAALPLSLAGSSAAVWTFGLFMTTLPRESVALAGIRVLYLGVAVGLPSVFVFALEYTGRERYVSRSLLAALSVHPILLLVFAWFNPGNLFFISLDAGAALGVQQQWGPAFWLHSGYAYLLVLVTALLVLELIIRSGRALYRGQALLLVTGVFAPLPFNALFLSGIVAFDTTPLGFVVMCSMFAVAIAKYNFADISPIAREKLIDSVQDGMIVVDTDDRIIDINPAANRMLRTSESALGTSVEDALTLPESVAAYEELTAAIEPGERTVSVGDRYFTAEATPIFDGREGHAGWLFLLQDVTDQHRRERELERQIEQLDQFASLVSHDLRGPITIANGYIAQTRITEDLSHLDDIEAAIRRMEAIIQDVLTLAREGRDVTDPEPVSVETIAEESWTHVETDGGRLEIADDVTVLADPTRLTRLFENLFRNAIEHGAEARDESALTVTVSVADEQSSSVTLAVADDGVGIPDDEQDAVLEDGYTTGEDGTGLGLAIVEQIATAHGWTVSVTDSKTGGACFEIGEVSKPL